MSCQLLYIYSQTVDLKFLLISRKLVYVYKQYDKYWKIAQKNLIYIFIFQHN